MKLTEFDHYALARVLRALPLSETERSRCSAQAAALIDRLLPIPPYDRQRLLNTLIPPSEQQRVALTRIDVPPAEAPLALLSVSQMRALPPPRLLLPGLPAESLTVMYGESGAGKSFIALDYAIRLAARGIVVYIPTEGLRGYMPRLAAWEAYHRQPLPASLYFLASGLILTNRGAVDSITRQLKAWQRNGELLLLIIDTLAMSMVGSDENSARDMGIAIAAARELIISLGCSVLLIHHTAKGSLHERGSSALRGNADSMIKVTSYDDLIALECTKAKDFEPFARQYYALKPVELGGDKSLVPVPHDKKDGDRRTFTRLQGQIVETLTLETCLEGVTLRELAELTSSALSTLHRAVSRLMQQGYVEKTAKGYRLSSAGIALANRDDPARSGPDPTSKPSFLAHDPLIHVIQPVSQQTMQIIVDQVDQADQRIKKPAYYRAGL